MLLCHKAVRLCDDVLFFYFIQKTCRYLQLTFFFCCLAEVARVVQLLHFYIHGLIAFFFRVAVKCQRFSFSVQLANQQF